MSVVVAFTAGVSYAFVAVPAQTALQEELPEDVRGRVFGVLNTLVSLASFLPIIIVGPVADVIGPTAVIIICAAVVVGATAVVLVLPVARAWTRPAQPAETYQPVDPMTVATQSTSLTQPVRLRYVRADAAVPSPIDYDGLARSCPAAPARRPQARPSRRRLADCRRVPEPRPGQDE